MTEPGPLTVSELDAIDAWWRAANYLSVGQIYLLGNPCWPNPFDRSTSSPACSATGAPRPA